MQSEEVIYNRCLYAKSPRERLRRINYDRRRRGAPEIASLSETTLRIPLVPQGSRGGQPSR
jgi:hypothetical protein